MQAFFAVLNDVCVRVCVCVCREREREMGHCLFYVVSTRSSVWVPCFVTVLICVASSVLVLYSIANTCKLYM